MKRSDSSKEDAIAGIPKTSPYPFQESNPQERPLYNPVIESQIAKKTYEQA
jgi:hypothetical protein